MLVIKSYVEPKVKASFETTLNWLPLDTPTTQALANTNLVKAQTAAILIEAGIISSEEDRQRVATDKSSGYNEMGLADEGIEDLESDDEIAE